MKCLFIIITFLAFSCKGKSEKKQAAAHADTIITAATKSTQSIGTDTIKCHRFFSERFNLSDTSAIEKDSGIINGNKVIVIMARDTTSSVARIVALTQEHGEWNLIDSSGLLGSDGRGPHISLNGDSLKLIHGEHRGYKELQYIFDVQSGKFKFLQVTQYSNAPYEEDKNCNCGLEVYLIYNEKTQRLTIRTELRDYKRFQKLIACKQKEFARPDKQAWLCDITDIWAFGEEDILTVDEDVIKQLSTYKK